MKNKLYLINVRSSSGRTGVTFTRSNRGRKRYEPASASLRRLENHFKDEAEIEVFLMRTGITLARHFYH